MKRSLTFNENGTWTGFGHYASQSAESVQLLKENARKFYQAGQPIKESSHPIVQAECIRINDENETLTVLQFDRQSEVDDSIHAFVESLIPDAYRTDTEVDYSIEYNIEWIASLRDEIQDIILDSLKEKCLESWTENDTENFEMEFMPYYKLGCPTCGIIEGHLANCSIARNTF